MVTSCNPDDLIPDDDVRSKLVGSWNCEESSEVYGVQHYEVQISEDLSDSTCVLISNFFDLGPGISASANVDDTNLNIAQQIFQGGFKISGFGVISNNYTRIDLVYTVEEIPSKTGLKSNGTESVTAVYTKK